MTIIEYENGMTVAELKNLIADWPVDDEFGDPFQVWLCDGEGLSNLAKKSSPLGVGDKGADLCLSHTASSGKKDHVEPVAYLEEVFFSYGVTGPVVRFIKQRPEVIIKWESPPEKFTEHRKIVPPIIDWDEYDGVCYLLGKSIFDHFLRIEKPFLVVEYRPGFVDMSDDPKRESVSSAEGALGLPWILAKCRDGYKPYISSGSIMCDGRVIANLRKN